MLYFYLGPSFQRTIAKHTIHGATVTRIGLATMPDWDVEIPKLSEQQAIADVLGVSPPTNKIVSPTDYFA